jgi:hypothetical protein
MNRRVFRTLLVIIGTTLAVATTSAPAAASGASQPAFGGLHDDPTSFHVVAQSTAGGNTIQTATVNGMITGTFVGSYVESVRAVFHATGEGNLKGTANCACHLGNSSGTIVFGFNAVAEPDGSLTGHFTIVSASGGLTGVTGQGIIGSPDGLNGFYSGQIRV